MPQRPWIFIGIVHDKDMATITQLFADAKLVINVEPVAGRPHEQRLSVQQGKKKRAEYIMDRVFYRSRHGHDDE